MWYPKRCIPVILIVALTLTGCFSACSYAIYFLANGEEIILSGYEAEYDITTKTILEELTYDNNSAFAIRKTELRFADKTPVSPVSWTQKDFFVIADGLNQTIRGETLERWQLNGLRYQIEECGDAPFGIQSAILDYYAVVTKTNEGREIANLVTFEIYPRYEIVMYRESVVSFLGVVDSGEINIKKITIPADIALYVAEVSGGKDFRESINNNCKIDIWLNQSFLKSEWQVKYWAFPPNSDKIFLVDARSGKVSVQK